MSLAKLGFFAVLATIVAHAPQVANNLDVPNRVEASYAEAQSSPAIPLLAQSKNPELLSVGKILVASRNLGDPHFAQTVILLVQYDAGGVVGLILNRRTELLVSRVLADYKAAKDRSDTVYFGGPVDSQQIWALRTSPAKLDGATQICRGVYQIATKAQLEQALTDRAAPKLFMCIWAMPDGMSTNCKRKWNWARGSFFQEMPRPSSVPIPIPCGRS
jgi:hypothetical protein